MWHQRQQPILESLGVGHIYNIQKPTNLFKLICGGLLAFFEAAAQAAA
jgi:hypothetical protein